MVKYKYLISYSFTNDFNTGFGCIQVYLNHKINSFDRCDKIIKIIKDNMDITNVSNIIILNISLIDERHLRRRFI
ncbi:hypothetical protein Q3304_08695 [Clostridioides sp. GD02377]|uniref:hypothetical protein n=1 Tax=unclassified Clostridioides TaxID=2635829 RepID=UPI0038A93C74